MSRNKKFIVITGQIASGKSSLAELIKERNENYLVLDADDQIIGYRFVHLGRMMEMIKDGKDANEALEAAKGNYGRFNDAAKYIDPRKE